MTKNTKIILYTVGGVVTSAVAYFIYSTVVRKKAQSFDEDFGNTSTNTSPSNNTNQNNTATSVDEFVSGSAVQSRESYPLEAGMYGQKVYVMQSALKSLGKYSGNLDGKFGQKTREALKDYFYIACTWMSCGISYNNWKEIIDDAKSKGWGLNQAWSEAKSKYL